MRPVDAFTPVVEVIERDLGISCSGVRAGVVAEAIRHEMELEGTAAPAAFAARVAADGTVRARLAESLRVPETYLLREPAQLRYLRDEVLPTLAAVAGADRPLRLWSAGCASGEEAYSLALVLDEAGLGGAADILATDRSDAALEDAARGVYRDWSFRGLDEAAHGRYFAPTADGTGREVAAQLRRGIAFRHHDLTTDTYPRDLDLIVCRNVLLYLTPEHGAAVIGRFASALAPGGWLLLGSADPRYAAADLLEPVRTPAGSFYRRPGGVHGAGGRPAGTRQGAGVEPSRRPPELRRPRRETSRTPDPPGRPRAERPATVATAAVPDTLRGCEALLAERPLDATVHSAHATLLLEAGQSSRALRAATGAVFLSPDLAVAHLAVGRAHLAIGDPERASRAFGRARQLLAGAATDAPVPGSTVPAGRLLAVAAACEQRAAAWSA